MANRSIQRMPENISTIGSTAMSTLVSEKNSGDRFDANAAVQYGKDSMHQFGKRPLDGLHGDYAR